MQKTRQQIALSKLVGNSGQLQWLPKNPRQFTKDDIERVRVVHNLVKVRGMKLDAAASLIRRNKDGVEKTTDILDTLREIRAELMDIKHNLATLE